MLAGFGVNGVTDDDTFAGIIATDDQAPASITRKEAARLLDMRDRLAKPFSALFADVKAKKIDDSDLRDIIKFRLAACARVRGDLKEQAAFVASLPGRTLFERRQQRECRAYIADEVRGIAREEATMRAWQKRLDKSTGKKPRKPETKKRRTR